MRQEPVPIAYTALRRGTPVQAQDGQVFGEVESVLVVEDVDVFDGIVVTTPHGVRFVDADQIDRIFDTYVHTTVPHAEVDRLPQPDQTSFNRIRPGDRVGRSLGSRIGRLFGRGDDRP